MKYLDTINSILTYAPIVGGVVFLAFTYIWHLKGKLTAQMLKKCVWYAAIFFGLIVAAEIIAQYYAYKTDPFGKLFLPPHQSIYWFVFSMWKKFVAPYVLSFAAGLFMYAVARSTNASFKRELFVENDKYVFLLAALILSWPNYVLYLLLSAILVAVQTLAVSAIKKDFGERVVLTNALLLSIGGIMILSGTIAKYVELWKLTI